MLGVRDALPALRHVICVDRADADGMLDYQRLLADASDAFSPVATAAEDPALLIYTSGTTGARCPFHKFATSEVGERLYGLGG